MRIRLLICLGTLGWLLGAAPTSAATLIVDNGVLLGATRVDVDGVLYDVSFQDGICANLYDGCDENSDFPFANPLDSDDGTLGNLANQALMAQVFIDSPQGNFDSQPELTFGCEATSRCQVNTPLFLTGGGASIGILWVSNDEVELKDIATGSGAGLVSFDSSIGFPDASVYAVWSGTAVVPLPAAVWLFGSALLGLGALKRKKA